MNLFEDIICAWLIGGIIGGYVFANRSDRFKNIAWFIYILCSFMIPFVAYRICEIVR